ncbi:hypothetical protein [Ruminococcus sp. Marseille-P6503]|uniref:hypothetical protein n=1 Tax=Ruminococcus sp. Marseille-P6503 TaxID=2364796 RepID=UPI000F5456ED|nr:hypothetical protein [Ruminococcus sp. Marseille-P6503]
MKTAKLSLKAVIIRIIGSIALLCIIAFCVFCILFFKGLIPIYPAIDKKNVDEFCGGDLWSNVINEFENVEIDSISPLHSPSKNDVKENYSVRLEIQEKDKDQWIEDSIAVSSYVSQYLSDNPQCEINDFNGITVEIVYGMDANYVSFSNIYNMGKNKEKLDDFSCIRITSLNEDSLSFSDIAYFNNAEYLIVNVPIDGDTDFSILDELDSVKEMYLFVGDDDVTTVKQQVEAMRLPYTVNII